MRISPLLSTVRRKQAATGVGCGCALGDASHEAGGLPPLAALLRTFRWGYLHPGTHLTGQIAAMIHHSNLYMDVNL